MDIIQNLKYAEEKYKNEALDFGELNIEAMAYDCRKEIEKLRSENKKLLKEIEALRTFKNRFDGLYQQDLGLSGWHMNGELEPYDSFYKEVLKYAGMS